jgi:hypothetical protein
LTSRRHRSGQGTSPALPAALLDLAAGRHPSSVPLDDNLLRVAADHNMTGLLWSWAQHQPVDSGLKARLAIQDLAEQAHLARVWRLLEFCASRLASAGIEVATIKGVTTEARWYRRTGERPCIDVDLLLAPHQLGRVAEVIDLIEPKHPWAAHATELAVTGRIQSVTMHVDGLEVDLHLDLLKLGVPTIQSDVIWRRTIPYELPDGRSIRVLDDTTALLHLLVHLNKDRFQRLLGFADIARIVGAGTVDWRLLESMARVEGIEVAVSRSLEVVLEMLQLPWPGEVTRHRGSRTLAWNIIWRSSVRLRGTEGRLRFRRRQDLITLLARGRAVEATKWWLVSLWPPRPTVVARYEHIPGPYLWKLIVGRVEAFAAQRRSVQQQRAMGPEAGSPTRPRFSRPRHR